MIVRAIVAISITIMVCDAQAMTVLFDVDESASAITSVTPEDPLDDFVTGDFDFDRLNFSGGSVISANNPITFNNAFNQTTTIAPLVDASVTATSTVTYADLSFDIVTGSTQNGASPSDQSWSVSSDVTVQANGTISVTGLGDVNFSINTVKTVTTSGDSLLNTSDIVSLSADAGGTTIGIPFETALPLNIEASDITLTGNLAGFVGPVKNLIVNQINDDGSPTVSGTVVAHSSDILDIPEQVSFEILPNQSVATISTTAGLSASSNLQGTLEGLRNTTSVRIDSTSGQQITANVDVNAPLQVIGALNGVTLSASVDTLDLIIKYGIVSDVIQDGSSPALVQLMIEMFEIQFVGDMELNALINDTGNYVMTGTIDPFVLPLSGAQPISLYSDAQYEYLNIPFDMVIDSDFLLDKLTLDVEVTGIALLSPGSVGDSLLNSQLTSALLQDSFEGFSLQGEVLARRKISDVPIPSTLLFFGLGFVGFAAWRHSAEKIDRN